MMRGDLTLLAVVLGHASLVACDATTETRDAALTDARSELPSDAANPARDAAERDAGAPEYPADADAVADSSTSTDASLVDDRDAACAYDGAVISAWGCTGYVCKTDAGSALALETDGGWFVGGAEFSGALCTRSLGWPSAETSDRRTLLYALTRSEREALERGVPAFVYRGGPTSPVDGPLNPCDVRVSVSQPDCPATATLPTHASRRGCRSPEEDGCAECRELGTTFTFRSAAPAGTSSYNVSGVAPSGPCTSVDTCPACAPCTLRDSEQLGQLGERPECEPCPADNGPDACFGPGTCACYCENATALRARCPAL